MLNHDLDLDSLMAARPLHLTAPPARAAGPEDRFDPDRCLTSLGPNLANPAGKWQPGSGVGAFAG